jgi:Protein of unknown function (DUF3467)
MAKEREIEAATVGNTATVAGQVKVRWDDTNMRSTYANVCNVAGTREEIVFLFGMNQAWHSGQKEVTVQLAERIVLSPFAAKRLSLLLSNVVRDYETRYGALDAEPSRPADSKLS